MNAAAGMFCYIAKNQLTFIFCSQKFICNTDLNRFMFVINYHFIEIVFKLIVLVEANALKVP